MEQTSHKYITVAYELFSDNEQGIHELIEKAPTEHPFQFISGLGVTLDAFEQHIKDLHEGDAFDFTLSVEDAYGPYVDEHVVELDKQVFCVDGHFDNKTIYPGNVIPLVNADGHHFQGLILEVKSDKVVVDLNHPLAGKELHFRGSVVTSREATPEEVQGMLHMLSGEGCGCGCGEDGCDCGDEGCGCHGGEAHGHEGCGCGHHH
jgi:FKBP-type peptidyl-prolyl cis-trans isomerase SlyD